MATILLLCVLAAALWLLASLRARPGGTRPVDSVDAYSRALGALAPDQPPAGAPSRRASRPAPVRPAGRGGAGRAPRAVAPAARRRR